MPSTTGTLTKSTDNAKLAKVAAEVAAAGAASQKERSQEKETSGQQQQSSGAGVKTPPEQPEFIKQALIIIEKKVRNLEKRRQKLDEYKSLQSKNQKLNEDQLSAVSKYDEVIRTLELSRELEKQFISLANDAMKQQKKQAKKEQTEREEAIKDKIKETQKFLAVLDVFGQESVRNDFLNEQNGAVKITQVELDVLDEFNKLARPTELGAKLETAAAEAADHLVALVDAKNKPIVNLAASSSFTYAELRRLFDRVLAAPYWSNQQQQLQQDSEPSPVDAPVSEQVPESVHAVDSQSLEQQLELNKLSLHHDEQLHQLQQQQQHVVLDQAVYHQQNTSDDYVIVTSTDLNDKDAKATSPSQLAQQQANKTFFTTLNPADLQRNINEFISDDGINFLQDSEIQQLHQQQQQAYQQHVAVQQVEQQQPQTDATGANLYQNQLIAAQQPQQMHPNMQTSNYGAQPGQQQQYVQMNQDFGGDISKEQGYRGPRGQGGPRNYPPRNQQRYDGERRGPRNAGAPPAQQGGQGPRNPSGAFNGQRQGQGMNGNGPQGGGGGYRQNNYAQNRQGGGGGNGAYRGGDRRPAGGNQVPRQGGYQQQPQAV